MGGGGRQVVNVLASYSDDPSSNATDVWVQYLCENDAEKNENKQKVAEVGWPILQRWNAKCCLYRVWSIIVPEIGR